MYSFDSDKSKVRPVGEVQFRLAAKNRAKSLQVVNSFLGGVIERVAELIPSEGVLPDEYAAYAFQAADEVQAAAGDIDDNLYQRAGRELLALCKLAAEEDMEPGVKSEVGVRFRDGVEQSLVYQLAFTSYGEQLERHS